jgi:type IV secretory pathway VirB9-like protein
MRRVIGGLALCLAATLPQLAHAQAVRDVTVNTRAVTRVNTKLRFTTMLVLPETEEILDFVCGDKDFWVISGAQNLAYVKPAKTGVTTNLNLITASGHIYSFLLTEGPADADLKVYLTLEDKSADAATAAPKRFVSVSQVEALQRQVEAAHAEADAAREAASQAMEAAKVAADRAQEDALTHERAFRAGYPSTLQFPYAFRANVKPFWVSSIFNDGRFTYIRANAKELPTLYEVKDRVPNLVNFEVRDGLFIVPKVLDEGYLAIGTQRLVFGPVR